MGAICHRPAALRLRCLQPRCRPVPRWSAAPAKRRASGGGAAGMHCAAAALLPARPPTTTVLISSDTHGGGASKAGAAPRATAAPATRATRRMAVKRAMAGAGGCCTAWQAGRAADDDDGGENRCGCWGIRCFDVMCLLAHDARPAGTLARSSPDGCWYFACIFRAVHAFCVCWCSPGERQQRGGARRNACKGAGGAGGEPGLAAWWILMLAC